MQKLHVATISKKTFRRRFHRLFLPVIASDNRKKLHSASLHGIHKFFMSFFSFIISHHQQKLRPVWWNSTKKTQQSLLTVKIFVHINCLNCWVNFSSTNERLRWAKNCDLLKWNDALMMGEEKKMTINVETRNYFIYCIYAGGFVRKRTRERERERESKVPPKTAWERKQREEGKEITRNYL
jgi:hypothetical protein